MQPTGSRGRTCLFFAAAVLTAHSQTLLVLNKEGSLSMVDPTTYKVRGSVRTGEGPHEVETDGKLAYVSNYGTGQAPGGTLSVIDIAGRKEVHRVDLGPLRRPHGLAISEGKCYFTAEANKIVGRYDPGTRQIDLLIGTGQNGTHMVMAGKAAAQLYTANIASDSITIIDAAGVGNWALTHIAVGKGPEGFDLTPDGKQLWTATSRDGGISVIDVAGKRLLDTFNVQTRRSNRLKFTPDGRLVLISDLEAGELVVIERATRKQLKRLKIGRGLAGILITPDGARAYTAATGDDNVAVIDLKTLELVDRIKTGIGPDGMAWVSTN